MMNSPGMSIWLGYDTRETTAFAVARHSIKRFDRYIPIRGLVLDDLKSRGMYYRPTEIKQDVMLRRRQFWDVISDAPMSTEFAISRFLVPVMARSGWALFADSDILVRRNPSRLFELARPDKAVMCVKHNYEPKDLIKMDGKLQTLYRRKNWSSVMLFNCDHPSNKILTVDMVNSVPGRDLHAFSWLTDDEIGELPREWNYLVGHTTPEECPRPSIVHFTEGLPDMPGYEEQEYAEEWRAMRPYAVGAL